MPSCTTPTFSKIAVTLVATQPAMLVICHASGNAIATAPTSMRPAIQSQIAVLPVPTTRLAFITASVTLNSVVMRTWRREVAVCSSIASRTKSSSSFARAKSLTVRMLV